MSIKRVVPYYEEKWLEDVNRYIKEYSFWHEGIISELENRIKKYTGRKYAIAVNSGTNAIFMCLFIIQKENKEKNEVIFPNWGYPGISNVCKTLEMKPISVDLKLNTLAMNPNEIKKAITEKTIAVVHTGNNGTIGSDIETIKQICMENKIFFIEDSAPSLLQKFNDINAGCFGDVGVFSFSPTKPVICGEGAVIVTDNEELYEKLKTFRHMSYSSDNKNFKCFSESDNEGSLNFSLSPFLAAYAVPQLDIDNLNNIIEKREHIYDLYKQRLNVFGEKEVTNRYGAIMYISDKANKISKKFNLYEIEHRYKYYPLYNKDLPVSKKIFDNLIDLPSNYFLTEKQINAICMIIKGT